MIGRIVWTILLALIAVVTVFAQFDREARRDPAYAVLVPAPWSGFSAQRLAEAAIAADDPARASYQADLLIRARPLPAEHMRLLSQAAALDGNTERALAALEAASVRGWRDPVTQLAAGQSAFAQGEYDAAVQRIVALLSTGSAPEQTLALLAELLTKPEGRVSFAKQIAVSGNWQRNLLAPASRVVAPMDFAQTIALAKREGAVLDCAKLASLAQGYGRAGENAAAELFWPGDCS